MALTHLIFFFFDAGASAAGGAAGDDGRNTGMLAAQHVRRSMRRGRNSRHG